MKKYRFSVPKEDEYNSFIEESPQGTIFARIDYLKVIQAKYVVSFIMKGDEVVQVYVHDKEASVKVPIRQLKRFQRIFLKPKNRKL